MNSSTRRSLPRALKLRSDTLFWSSRVGHGTPCLTFLGRRTCRTITVNWTIIIGIGSGRHSSGYYEKYLGVMRSCPHVRHGSAVTYGDNPVPPIGTGASQVRLAPWHPSDETTIRASARQAAGERSCRMACPSCVPVSFSVAEIAGTPGNPGAYTRGSGIFGRGSVFLPGCNV